MQSKSMEEKERLAEDAFMGWLNDKNIPFLYIHQEKSSFSKALKRHMTRRPDFIILIPNIGFILTDVEYCKPADKYPRFYVDVEETEKYRELQGNFNLQVWYVFGSDKDHFNTWYWIPVATVTKKGKKYQRKGRDQEYYSVALEDFVAMHKRDDLGRLLLETQKFD